MLFLTVAVGVLHAVAAQEAAVDSSGNVIFNKLRSLYHRPGRENCSDNPAYVSPIAFGTNCDFFAQANCGCEAWSALFSQEEMVELYKQCPISCDIPCDYVVPEFPTPSPTLAPTVKGDVGTCEDDPLYKWRGTLSCANINAINMGCDLPLFTDAEKVEMNERCPGTCDANCGGEDGDMPTLSPTVCVDDPNHQSIVNPVIGCEMYVHTECPRWAPIFALLSGNENEVENVMTSCPVSCGLCGSITDRPTVSPTKSPTSSPTVSPTSAPTSLPTSAPTSSPTVPMCYDNDDYVSPLHDTEGCDLYAALANNGECDCSLWESLMTDEQINQMYLNCPITCDKPCGYLHTPTSAPTAAPDTTCVDDPTYVSPINSAFGCEFHLFTPQDCLYWCPVHISPEELVELLDRCPHSCGLCGEDTNPDTLAPTISPSRGCRDDPTYIHPTKPMWTCETFKTANCMELRPIFEPDDFADLLHRCPEACDAPCDYTPPPTESRTGSPTMQPSSRPSSTPSIKPTVSQSPTDCLDDRDYIFPLNQNWGCEEIHDNEVDCLSYRHDLLPEEFLELVRKCPKACHVSCDYTIPPTMSPTVAPTSKPSPSPSIAPSVSHAPTDCFDDENYVSPIDPSWTCAFFEQFEDCMLVRPLCTPEAFEELLHKCPKACKISCDYTPPPTVSPTAKPSSSPSSKPSARPSSSPSSKPTSAPSIAPSVSHAPTDCFDDENYVSPIDPSWTCAFFEQFEDCMLVRPLCTPEAFEELLHKCPKACKISCDYTPPPTESPTTHPSYSPSSAPSSKPSFIASSNPTMSAMPSVAPTSVPSVAPTNCPEVPDCQAHVCVDPNMTNLALGGTASASSNTNKSNVNGPINGITDTSITPTGSTFESQDGDDQWWQVALPRAANISQIKIFACDGPECGDEGKKLNNIKVDIKLGNTIVSSHFFVYDFKPVMDLVLPFPIPGSSVRITKMQDDQVLSLSEVQVIGKMLNECSGTNC